MAWPGGKCTRVRSIACTGQLLPAAIRRTKDVHRPTFPNIPDRVGVRENYPASSRRRRPRQRSPGLKRRVKRAGHSAGRNIAMIKIRLLGLKVFCPKKRRRTFYG
jgi:hypothetical protein